MKKKEFKLQIATNPVLHQWLLENALWIKAKPEVMAYLRYHPEGLNHFRQGQPVDNEKIHRHAQLFIQQKIQEKMNQKQKKEKPVPVQMGKEGKEKRRKKGLFSNFKSMFEKFNHPSPAAIPANGKMPALQPPGPRVTGRKPVAGSVRPQQKPGKKTLFGLPRIKLNRRKVMDTLTQTTEMLDVVAALIGKVGNLK